MTITAREWATDPQACRERADGLGYPLFVKPARGGSSIGISKAHDASELDACLEEAHRHDPKALVEVSAEGAREVECGVLQAPDGTPETSLPAEIRITGDHEFYDFAAKYLPEEATELDVPADLPDDVTSRLRELAARTFEAVSCEGLARVDFFVMPDAVPGGQRDQHHARVHAAVDVPADVGGHRRGLPRARGPADPARARPRHRAALTHFDDGVTRTRIDQPQVLPDRIGELGHDRGDALGPVVAGDGHLDDGPVARSRERRRSRTGRPRRRTGRTSRRRSPRRTARSGRSRRAAHPRR